MCIYIYHYISRLQWLSQDAALHPHFPVVSAEGTLANKSTPGDQANIVQGGAPKVMFVGFVQPWGIPVIIFGESLGNTYKKYQKILQGTPLTSSIMFDISITSSSFWSYLYKPTTLSWEGLGEQPAFALASYLDLTVTTRRRPSNMASVSSTPSKPFTSAEASRMMSWGHRQNTKLVGGFYHLETY